MPTPHISAATDEIAPLVLMPGDPRRAELVAKHLLDDPELVSQVRGITAFTGTHRGTRLTVMASGMGVPSISIYVTELCRFYNVRRIARIGTAGLIDSRLSLGDVVIAANAHTDSAIAVNTIPGVSLAFSADPAMLAAAISEAGSASAAGPVFTTDLFYLDRPSLFAALERIGTLAVEMETAGLYATAAAERAQAISILSITDDTRTGTSMTADQRENTFQQMTRVGLAALLAT